MSDGFATAQRVSVWTQPSRQSAPFQAWGEALRAAFEPPVEPMAMPSPGLDEIELPVATNEDPFADGYAAGVAAARVDAEADAAALDRLAAAIAGLRPEPSPILGAMIAATVERLVGEIVGAVEIDVATLAARAAAAAELIEGETRPAVLRLNPADLARLEGMALPVAVIADAGVPTGDLRLEAAGGSIEDGVSVRLEKLRLALERAGATR